jgi:hypothetical protein
MSMSAGWSALEFIGSWSGEEVISSRDHERRTFHGPSLTSINFFFLGLEFCRFGTPSTVRASVHIGELLPIFNSVPPLLSRDIYTSVSFLLFQHKFTHKFTLHVIIY